VSATPDVRAAGAGRAPAAVSVAVVSTHGVGALRATLHRLRETVGDDVEVVVLAARHAEDVMGYITRHYLSGDVAAIALEASEREIAHCGIDAAFQMSGGEILVRVQDDLTFAPGWLDAVVGALRANPDIGMLGLVADDEPRRRGRPPKVRPPEQVDHVDLRAFAVTQTVLREHVSELKGDRCADGCRFQPRLRRLGYRIAYLPGQLAVGGHPVAAPSGAELEADLAFHPGEREALARLQQSYRLGEEVLTPCAACDEEEFEVLAAQIDFCEAHAVPLGYTYTLRCTGCHALRSEEDHQFRCPT
jgi:hypothetical protein